MDLARDDYTAFGASESNAGAPFQQTWQSQGRKIGWLLSHGQSMWPLNKDNYIGAANSWVTLGQLFSLDSRVGSQ